MIVLIICCKLYEGTYEGHMIKCSSCDKLFTSKENGLALLTKLDPATYAVDALRNAMLGIATYPFALDVEILAAFTIVFGVFGGYSFRRMRAV